MGRLAIALVGAALALGASGCFALEEIDSGQERMRQDTSRAQDGAQEAAEAQPDDGEGLLARARRWWRERQEGEDDATGEARSGPPPHPDDVSGRCELDGRTQFMRKFDCQLRGGRYVPLDRSAGR